MRVHLVHWDADEAHDRVGELVAMGHDAVHLPGVTGTPLLRALRAGAAECFLIDLGRRPSHGREVAMALRASPATRHRPIVIAGGDDEATSRLRTLLPDAVYTSWRRVRTALPRALKSAPAQPIVPSDRLFPARSLAQKLGISAGERVAVVGAPSGFAGLLGPLPAGARLTAEASATADRFVWFVTSSRELDLALGRLAVFVTDQVAWLVWPKGGSGDRGAINGNTVREAGLGAGLVDFKVCSVDATWSGLAFKRRRR